MRSLLPVKARLPRFTTLLLGLLILAAFFLPSPYVMLSPGSPQNVLGSAIKISGTTVYPTTGKLSVTSVMVTDPDSYVTGFDVLYGWVASDRAVLPRDEIYPKGESVKQSKQQGADEMSSSQTTATAAALSYLGYESTSKLVVTEINKNSNSYQVLQPADQIISIDGVEYKSPNGVVDYLDNKKPGDFITIKVLRDEVELLTKQIKLSARDDGSAIIGVIIERKFNFPFKVDIKLADTGGPSGGLVFALGIIEKLTPDDLISSRNIAGTGTITADGQVGPIGGIIEKIIGARRAGVSIFLTPTSNCQDIKSIDQAAKGEGVMKIVPVATLQQAVDVLKLPTSAKYPSCLASS